MLFWSVGHLIVHGGGRSCESVAGPVQLNQLLFLRPLAFLRPLILQRSNQALVVRG